MQNVTHRGDPSDFRTIQLIPWQDVDGSWRCQYRILEGGTAATDQRVGYAEGTFETLPEAIMAAKQAAQRVIDSLPPPNIRSQCAGVLIERSY